MFFMLLFSVVERKLQSCTTVQWFSSIAFHLGDRILIEVICQNESVSFWSLIAMNLYPKSHPLPVLHPINEFQHKRELEVVGKCIGGAI